jgi:hypothetical protein
VPCACHPRSSGGIIRRIVVQASFSKNVRPYAKNKVKRDWGVAEVEEYLLSTRSKFKSQYCQKKKKTLQWYLILILP